MSINRWMVRLSYICTTNTTQQQNEMNHWYIWQHACISGELSRLKNITSRRLHTVWLHLYTVVSSNQIIEMENSIVVWDGVWKGVHFGHKHQERVLCGWNSSGGDGYTNLPVVMVIQIQHVIKLHRTAYAYTHECEAGKIGTSSVEYTNLNFLVSVLCCNYARWYHRVEVCEEYLGSTCKFFLQLPMNT